MSMLDMDTGHRIWVTCVYASCDGVEQRLLWDHLRSLSQMKCNVPWCVVGDFNSVLSSVEKKGGLFPRGLYIVEFKDCMSECMLSDVGFIGSLFTWCNNQHGDDKILSRLDRCLINDQWQEFQVSVNHLARVNSDHAPLLLKLSRLMDSDPRAFILGCVAGG